MGRLRHRGIFRFVFLIAMIGAAVAACAMLGHAVEPSNASATASRQRPATAQSVETDDMLSANAVTNSLYLPIIAKDSGVGGTPVGGGIFNNTTWSKTLSPYLVISDVVVFSGHILTIEPGVEVRFASGTSLTVRGTLIASGSDREHIRFVSNKVTPAKKTWKGVTIDTRQNATATIQFVEIESADKALTMTCCFVGKLPSISDSVFRFNDTGIVGDRMPNNWWGTTDVAAIDRTIFDARDDIKVGLVQYQPFATGPVDGAGR